MLFKRSFLFVVAFLLSSCSSLGPPKSPPPPTLFELSQNSTVAIVASEEDGVLPLKPFCAGIFISQDQILTAFHCVQANAKITKVKELPPMMRGWGMRLLEDQELPTIGTTVTYITFSEMPEFGFPPLGSHTGKVIKINKEHDLALIKLSNNDIPKHLFLKIAPHLPNVNDKVIISGHPGMLYFTYLEGQVSGIRHKFAKEDDEPEDTVGPFLQVNCNGSHGNSGGAIISENGDLLGMNDFIREDAPGQMFAVSSSVIKNFLSSKE